MYGGGGGGATFNGQDLRKVEESFTIKHLVFMNRNTIAYTGCQEKNTNKIVIFFIKKTTIMFYKLYFRQKYMA